MLLSETLLFPKSLLITAMLLASVRKFFSSKCDVFADGGKLEYSNNVWIDHVDVSSDMDHDKDYYDGLIDVYLLR